MIPESQSCAINDYISKNNESVVSYSSYKQSISGVKSDSESSDLDITKLSKLSNPATTTSPATVGVWEHDKYSPACQLYCYNKCNISLIWTPEATYRYISDGNIEVFIHNDKSIIICQEMGEKYDHYA